MSTSAADQSATPPWTIPARPGVGSWRTWQPTQADPSPTTPTSPPGLFGPRDPEGTDRPKNTASHPPKNTSAQPPKNTPAHQIKVTAALADPSKDTQPLYLPKNMPFHLPNFMPPILAPKDTIKISDFEQRYPVDPVGTETASNARVWRIYRDRMTDLDDDTIAGWNDSINFLLVFAGLFSAVMTAFLIEGSKRLQPDYTEYSARSLRLLVLQSTGASITIASSIDPSHFVAPVAARLATSLWFFSLALALIVSMLAILSKQWITMFSSRMRAPVSDLRRWAHRHHAFRNGLDAWQLDLFVSTLSLAIHASVLLFLVGLNIYLFNLDLASFVPVTALTTIAAAFYLCTTFAPLVWGTCPTLTPILVNGSQVVAALLTSLGLGGRLGSAAFEEATVLSGPATTRDMQVIYSMVQTLPAGGDIDAALDSIGALHSSNVSASPLQVRELARARVETLPDADVGSQATGPSTIARVLRTCLVLEDAESNGLARNFIPRLSRFASIDADDVSVLANTLSLQLDIHNHATPDDVCRKAFEVLVDVLTRRKDRFMDLGCTEQTCSIVLETIRRAAESRPLLIRAHEAANLSLALGTNAKASEQCYTVITPILTKLISSRDGTWCSFPPSTDWRLRATQVWANILENFRAFQRDDVRLRPASRNAIWKCYAGVLSESYDLRPSSDQEAVLSVIRDLVLPFAKPLKQWETFTPKSTSRGAFNLFLQSLSEFSNEPSGWSAAAADVAFNILLPVESKKQDRGADLESNLANLLFNLSRSPAGTHSMIDGRLADVSVEGIAGAVRESPVNLLLTRIVIDGHSASLWTIIFALLYDTAQERYLADLAAVLAPELAMLAMLDDPDVDVEDMADELLGDGRGLAFVLSRHSKPSTAFAIARHAASFDLTLWNSMKEGLRAKSSAEWNRTTGYASVAAFIQAVESAGPCAACEGAVLRSRKILEDPEYPKHVHAKRQEILRRGHEPKSAQGAWKSISRPRQPKILERPPMPSVVMDHPSTSFLPLTDTEPAVPSGPKVTRITQGHTESLIPGPMHANRRVASLPDVVAPQVAPLSSQEDDANLHSVSINGEKQARQVSEPTRPTEGISRSATAPPHSAEHAAAPMSRSSRPDSLNPTLPVNLGIDEKDGGDSGSILGSLRAQRPVHGVPEGSPAGATPTLNSPTALLKRRLLRKALEPSLPGTAQSTSVLLADIDTAAGELGDEPGGIDLDEVDSLRHSTVGSPAAQSLHRGSVVGSSPMAMPPMPPVGIQPLLKSSHPSASSTSSHPSASPTSPVGTPLVTPLTGSQPGTSRSMSHLDTNAEGDESDSESSVLSLLRTPRGVPLPSTPKNQGGWTSPRSIANEFGGSDPRDSLSHRGSSLKSPVPSSPTGSKRSGTATSTDEDPSWVTPPESVGDGWGVPPAENSVWSMPPGGSGAWGTVDPGPERSPRPASVRSYSSEPATIPAPAVSVQDSPAMSSSSGPRIYSPARPSLAPSVESPLAPSAAKSLALSSHSRSPSRVISGELGSPNPIKAQSPSSTRRGTMMGRSTVPSLLGPPVGYDEWGYADGADTLSTPRGGEGSGWDHLVALGGGSVDGMGSPRPPSVRSHSGASAAMASPASISLSSIDPSLFIMPEVPWNTTPTWARHCWQAACVRLQERVQGEPDNAQASNSIMLQQWKDEAAQTLLKELQMRLLLDVGPDQVEVFEEMFEADHMFVVSYLTGQNA